MSGEWTPEPWQIQVIPTTAPTANGPHWASCIIMPGRAWSNVLIHHGEPSSEPPPPHPDALLIVSSPRLAEELTDLAEHLEAYDPQGDVRAWLRTLLDYHLPEARAVLARVRSET